MSNQVALDIHASSSAEAVSISPVQQDPYAPPFRLNIQNKTFVLKTDQRSRGWIDEIPFARVRDRTNTYLVYEPAGEPKRGASHEIVVATPQELFHFVKQGRIPIARKFAPWHFSQVMSTRNLNVEQVLANGPDIIARYRKVLGYDKLTEGVSLRFFDYIARAKQELPGEIWSVLLLWLRDEINHHNFSRSRSLSRGAVHRAFEKAINRKGFESACKSQATRVKRREEPSFT